MEKTSHMMIDFADAFSTNVYQIGAIFLQLRVMFLEKSGLGVGMMPLVDPGLYMVRFVAFQWLLYIYQHDLYVIIYYWDYSLFTLCIWDNNHSQSQFIIVYRTQPQSIALNTVCLIFVGSICG